jgi:CRISPR-associated protein Csx17
LDEFVLNKGKELPGRGEQWFPIWSAPTTAKELQNVFRQGQAATSRKRASDGFSMAKAIATLGVSRGVSEFVRYGYLQRNNQATHYAVPLGRFAVPDQATPALACLDDLDGWLVRLRREARAREAPARFVQAEHSLADALFALTQHPDEAPRWQLVLERLADVEALQIHGVGIKAGPIPRLRAQWLEVADDGSAEFRLAAAFALQCNDASHPVHDSIRRHWLTLGKGRFKTTGSGGSQRLAPDTDRVMQGRDGEVDALAVLSRRLVEAAQQGERRLPLEPGFDVSASRHDLARLLTGGVDIDRCLRLARALMALDRDDLARRRPRLTPATPADWPDDAWLAIRLALLPWPLPDGHHAGVDPAIVRRLEAGDAASAVAIAVRRLRAAEIPCAVRVAATTHELARRYAAALAFPISQRTAAQCAQRLSPLANKEQAA